MKVPKPLRRVIRASCASSLMLALAAPALAQKLPDPEEEEIVRLSPFAVEERADIGRYQAVEASSGTRIRMDLMDATQSISVITSEFIQDVGAGRLLDAAKYVAGISESNSTSGFDRMNVRGFISIGGATIDGFNQFNWINQDPVITERLEVVKGPNAILAPQGLPGGVLNNVTKRPLFTGNKGYLSQQLGRWNFYRTEMDANYVMRPNKLAFRVVGAFTDTDEYRIREFSQNITVMPMFTYRISPTTDFTLQIQAYNSSHLGNNNGIPISLYAYGRNNVRLQEGLRRDFQYAGRSNVRHQSGQFIRFFLTSQITDKLSTRLGVNMAHSRSNEAYYFASTANIEVVKLDPITGEWGWDGITRNDTPTYKLGGEITWPVTHYANLQNDYFYEHSGAAFKSKTVIGFAINYNSNTWKAKTLIPDPTGYDFTDSNYTPPPYTAAPNWRDHSSARHRGSQVYIYEVLSLFEERLLLSGGLSHNRYFSGTRYNRSGGAYAHDRGEVLLPSAGVVYKVTPGVSLYYGFGKQELLGSASPSQGIPPHTIPSRQHEGGLRFRLFDGKLYATIAYFYILQKNLYEVDFRNYITPRPSPTYPPALAVRTSKGVEVELTWSPTKRFSMTGSYIDFKNRDQDKMPYSNVPENTAALWGSYIFSDTGALHGLSVGLGANYVSERPGDANGRWTEPPEGYLPVRVQPMFWLPSYVLVEGHVSYRVNNKWSAQLHVRNLLNRDYVSGSFLRGIFVSTPINPRLTLRYDF